MTMAPNRIESAAGRDSGDEAEEGEIRERALFPSCASPADASATATSTTPFSMHRSLSGRVIVRVNSDKRPSMRKRASVSSGEGKWLAQARQQERKRSLKREQSTRNLSQSLHVPSRRSFGSNSNRGSVRALLGRSHHSHGIVLNLSRHKHTDTGGGEGSSSSGMGHEATNTGTSPRSEKDDTVSVPNPPTLPEEEEAEKVDDESKRVLFAASSGDKDNVELSYPGGAAAAAIASLNDGSDAITAPPASSEEDGSAHTDSNHPTSRKVNFSSCTVQYYNTVLGDNPFVSSGASLSLGWKCDPSATDRDIPIDAYESSRSPLRRYGWDLILSRAERERRLLDGGTTRDAIAGGVRDVMHIKHQRRRTVLNLGISGAEEWMEGVTRAFQRGVGVRGGSRCLYDSWIRAGGTAAAAPAMAPGDMARDSLPSQRERELSCLGEDKMQAERDGAEEQSPLALLGGDDMKDAPLQTYVSEGPAFGISRLRTGSLRGELLLERAPSDEEKVEEGYSGGEEDAEQRTAPPVSAGTPPTPATNRYPFAVIELVHPHSPAAEAGLLKGDRIIKFGGATADNHRSLRAVTDLGRTAAAKEKSVPVTVLRPQDGTEGHEGEGTNQREATLQFGIRPRVWSGVGHFGFLLRRC